MKVDRFRPEMVKLLPSHGARVDARGYIGLVPLIYAAGRGYTETARLLLEHGADPDIRCPDGRTAEEYAVGYHHEEIVEMCAVYRARITSSTSVF